MDEFCAVCGYNRKTAIRLLNSPITEAQIHGRGRRIKYQGDTVRILQDLWHLTGRICAERLKQAIPEWIEWYYRENSGFNPVDIQLVLQMSKGTIARHVQTFRKQENTGKSNTRRSNWWFRSQIPIKAG